MKKFICLLLVAMLCMSFYGCKKDPVVVDPPVNPDPDPPEVPVVINWITDPSFVCNDIEVLDLYYDTSIPQRSKYLAFEQGGRWGLINQNFEIVVEPVSQDIPFFCPIGELHLSASDAELDALVITADDIQLAGGGHGGYYVEYVYEVNEKQMYVLAGDVGYELYLPSQYPDEIPAVVPVAFFEKGEEEPYGWGPEILYKKTYGYCTNGGTLISTIEYEYACPFVDGIAAAKRGGAWGYIDSSLNPLTTFTFRGCSGNFYNSDGTFIPDFYPYFFVDNYAVVRNQDGKYGVIDKTGEDVLPTQFDKIVPVAGGRAMILKDGMWGLAQLG